ncbi:hypothetical protein I4U23_005511 [Adineta vaga]|nr:hypothetical protein I4U23_005511 [Adineta vaga]
MTTQNTKHLFKIVNLSTIKHLTMSYLSSLEIHPKVSIDYLRDDELCEYLNKSIKKLRIGCFTNENLEDLEQFCKVGVETTLKCGFPILAEGTVKVSASITVGFSYGSQTTEEKSNEYTLEVLVPANSTIDASMFVIEGTVEVPFTSHLTIKYSDGTEETRDNQVGTYRGVMASNANVVFGVAKPIMSSPDGNTKVISG